MKSVLALLATLLLLCPATARELTAATDSEALPDTQVATGDAGVAAAWFVAPTGRYDHHVRDTQYEAGGLRVRLTSGAVLTLRLDEEHVFEDRQPRLADLDGDGRDEILVVLSSIREGASLAAYGVAGDDIALLARTPFIGTPHRWLNPAGIADYDGDGQLDIALVKMPHLVKRLELWTLTGGGFARTASLEDVSTHRLGSPHTGLSASADFDGDGILDLAVPDGSRGAVRLISFAGGAPGEIGRFDLDAQADGDFMLSRDGETLLLEVPLADGGTARLAL